MRGQRTCMNRGHVISCQVMYTQGRVRLVYDHTIMCKHNGRVQNGYMRLLQSYVFLTYLKTTPKKALNIETKFIIYHLNDKEFVENIWE